VLVFGAIVTESSPAQIMASERGTVSQVVDGTSIMIDYARPRLRGRDARTIFANEDRIPVGEVWTPGANDATILTVSRDVTINGVAVPAGAYSMWMVVDSSDSWLTALKTDTTLFHMPFPTIDPEDITFRTSMTTGGPTDALTWGFGTPRSTGVTAELRWADRVGTLGIVVQPSLPIEFPEERASPFLGEYRLELVMTDDEDPEWNARFDTTMTIAHRDGLLWANWNPWFYPIGDDNILIPLTDDWFTYGLMLEGELFEVQKWMTFEFAVENGKATGFEVRLEDDGVFFRGKRIE
jgi:hypothetical protein